ncbi:MAG: serine hydrolase domain-containing protein [Promethearchaeota archaeon]
MRSNISRKLSIIIIGISFVSMIFIGLIPHYIVAQTSAGIFPEFNWTTTTPEEQNLNSSYIEAMYDYISDIQSDFHSVLIVRNGYIIDEEYLYNYERIAGDNFYVPFDPLGLIRDNTKHNIYSCTKSITSLLIGITIEEGFIDNVTQTFFGIFQDKWKSSYGNETKKDITIEHILTMTSGFEWAGITETFGYWQNNNFSLDYVLEKSLINKPGSSFTYNTGSTQLLSALIQNRTNIKTSEFAKEYLFEPIGIQESEWEWDEVTWEWGSGVLTEISHGGFGIFMTPRAMARIGLLALNNGTWDGNQVIPKEWIEVSTSAHVTEGLTRPGTEYGYGWWLYPKYYGALGGLGQQIIIIPEYDIVVIFTHSQKSEQYQPEMDYIINNFIIKAVIIPDSSISRHQIPSYNLFLILGIISVTSILINRKLRMQSNRD